MTFKYAHNCKWFLLFHHNVVSGGLFSNKSEALFCNTKGKFSILSQLNEGFQYNSKYEFLLEYSGFDYIQWTQKKNPITTTESDTKQETLGVKIKHNQYDNFRGLALSNTSFSLLDGEGLNIEGYHYSVGTTMWENNKIPGPFLPADECHLWVMFPLLSTCQNHESDHIRIVIFIFIFSLSNI